MHPAITRILDEQLRNGFADIHGSDISLTIPLTDRIVNELVAAALPPGGKVREVQLQAQANNQIAAKVGWSGFALLPSITVTLVIEGQPALPEHAVLTLRLSNTSKFVGLAASTLPAMVKLPPGINLVEDRIAIDLRQVRAAQGFGQWLPYLTHLNITTLPGTVVLHLRAAIR
jgi:hypothetical protein